jgi:hypothetical protein
MNFPL